MVFMHTAGITESLYDYETLAAYLIHKLNRLNPSEPAYLSLLPSTAPRIPIPAIEDLLQLLSARLGAKVKGGEDDTQRTAKWFVSWWREGGAKEVPQTHGWEFDFDYRRVPGGDELEEGTQAQIVERRVDEYVEEMKKLEGEGGGFGVSLTRERNLEREAKRKARDERRKAALTA